MDTWLERFAIALITCLLAFIVGMLLFEHRRAECAALGYTRGFVANLTVYCAARENGTDVVLSITKARLRPRVHAQ